MISGASDGQGGMMADINVTPLVDVMLVLLIIFMVTAPLLIPQTVGITLPKTAAVSEAQNLDKTRLTISNSALVLDGKELSHSQLQDAFEKLAENEAHSLLIEADKDVRFERVAKVLASAKAEGLQKISLLTIVDGAK